ncbi:MAG: dipeptidase PepE [Bacteroidota bacterium]
MRLLLISNSTNAGEAYLEYPMPEIRNFLGEKALKAVFIPYAGVSISYDAYYLKVRDRFHSIGQEITSIHQHSDPVAAIGEADVIVTGGGNTFRLISLIREKSLIEPVRKKVLSGTPYIGWSAGSNVACPSIRTTNDMPIVEPDGFGAFNLVPFQINPHYLDSNPDGHAGETREDRINEFLELNREITVIGLREGTMLRVEGRVMRLIGKRKARIFKFGQEAEERDEHQDFSKYLLG